MGKSKKPKVEVTEYYMSEHFGVCAGPPDALLSLVIKEKVAWTGSQSALGTITINNRELFGGVKKEGGVAGTVHFLPGDSDQVMPDALAQRLGRANGADCPGFRGLTSLFFYGSSPTGFYWSANTPYLPGVWAKVRRAPVGLDPDYALVPDGTTEETEASYGPTTGNVNGFGPFADLMIGSAFEILADGVLDTIHVRGDETPSSGNFRLVVYAATSPSTWGAKMGETAIVTGGVPANSVLSVDLLVPINVSVGDYVAICVQSETTAGFRCLLSTTGSPSYYFNDEFDDGAAEIAGSLTENSATTQPCIWATGTALTAAKPDGNPAHIIYECLTSLDWGMGSPSAAIDTTSFEDAAVTLYGEGFGLSMLWTRQASIQDFVQEVLDHIQAVLFVDPSTGLLTLKLIRDDYDEGTLPILTPDNADLTSFSRKLWGDIVNEIVVTWTNPENEQEETITVQDDSSIATQGGIVSDSRNYYGVRSASLAQDLAYRDLRSAGQPLASCEAEVDRTQWQLRPASVVKVTWPEYGLTEVVMRATEIDYGKPGDPTIKLSLIEDTYGLDIGTYDEPPSTEWEDPSSPPAPLETVEIFTLPYFFALDTTVADFVDSPEYPEVLAGVLATDDSDDTFSYELWDEVTLANGSLEWQSLGTNNIIGRGELVDALDLEATSTAVTFDNITGQTSPTVAGFVIIGEAGETGNEIAMVDAVGSDYTLVRGVLDTVPRAWPAGTPCWFVDGETLFEDPLVRAAGETVDYKLLSRTSQGLLALEDASLESYTLTGRPWLPNRPANVQAYGEAWSSQTAVIDAIDRADPWITVTWANRNRLTEDSQVLSWTDSTVTPEDGQTTTIEVRAVDGTLLTTHDGLSGTSFNVPDVSFASENIVRLRVFSERTDDDGDFVSLQFFEHWVQVAPLTADRTIVTADSTDWTADEGI